MPDENRVFDVTKPGHSSPDATSKPIIVGHRPTMSDPMMTDSHDSAGSYIESPPTQITVKDETHDQPLETHAEKSITPDPDNSSTWITPPAFGAKPQDSSPAPDLDIPPPEPELPPAEPKTDSEPEPKTEFAPENPGAGAVDEISPLADQPAYDGPIEPIGNSEGVHLSEPKPKSRRRLIAPVILLLLAGAYLAIDSGLVKTSINLPFHILKQKTAATVTPPASQPKSQPATTTIPVGFTLYKLAGTSLTFDAPTNWGQPNSSSDQGFSNRSPTSQSDGTYAYLVDFATNKDVQIVVTSSKFLPPARGALYYDFLQWCTGTSDGKIYKSILHFSTNDKTDTPTTVTCDQGPLADATKLDSSTIVQLNTKDAGGTAIGDLYTKNLSNPNLPVLRVKDAARTNSADIKQILNSVKAPAS